MRLKVSTKNRILYVVFFLLLIEMNANPLITQIILRTNLAFALWVVFKVGDLCLIQIVCGPYRLAGALQHL